MNETAQIILAIGSVITALGSLSTLVLGLLNRSTINTVKTQTDGMLTAMSLKAEEAEEKGHAKGKAEEIQYQRDNPPAPAAPKTPKISPKDS